MNTATITYELLWQLDFAPEYQFTQCGKCFNVKRGRIVKRLYLNRCVGYKIRGRFYSLTRLRERLEKIPVTDCPF